MSFGRPCLYIVLSMFAEMCPLYRPSLAVLVPLRVLHWVVASHRPLLCRVLHNLTITPGMLSESDYRFGFIAFCSYGSPLLLFMLFRVAAAGVRRHHLHSLLPVSARSFISPIFLVMGAFMHNLRMGMTAFAAELIFHEM